MSTVQSQILDVVGARLALPTEDRGYSQTVLKVERARVTPFRDFDLPAVNYWADQDVLAKSGAGWEERELSVLIDARSKTRDRPFVDVVFEVADDLWTALWRDPASPAVIDIPSPALGGLVKHLSLDSITPAIGEGQAPFCGALLRVAVRYRVRPGQPVFLIP